MKMRFFEKWKLYAYIPLMLLAVHFYLFPYLLGTTRDYEVPSTQNLVLNEQVSIGKYNGHAILITLGDFQNPEFLRTTRDSSAVVVSHFIELPQATTQISGAGRSILKALEQNSAVDATSYLDTLRDTANASPGDVITYQTSSPSDALIDAIFVIMFDKNDSAEENRDSLKIGLERVFISANEMKTATIFLPTLTVDPRHDNSVGERQFFEILFDTLPQSRFPKEIWVSLYNKSPSVFLTTLLHNLRTEWNARVPPDQPWILRLFRLEFRSTLLLLSLCLFVSAARTRLNLKNSLIISIAYLGAVAATTKTVEVLLTDQSEYVTKVVLLIIQILLAIFLYAFVYWDPKAVFSKTSPK